MNLRIRRFGVAFALSLFTLSTARGGEDCLRIGVSDGGVTGPASGDLAVKIFALANSCARVVMAPQNRVTAMEDRGELDGDAWRVPDYFTAKPNLVMVPTPVDHFSGSLFWLASHQAPSGGQAKVGILLGSFWAKQALHDLSVQIYEASSYDQLFRLTLSGHIDGFLMPTYSFRAFNHGQIDDRLLRARPVYDRPLHLAIDQRYAAMVPALDAAIKSLAADGTIAEMLSFNER